MKVKELASILGIKHDTVYHMIRSGNFPYYYSFDGKRKCLEAELADVQAYISRMSKQLKVAQELNSGILKLQKRIAKKHDITEKTVTAYWYRRRKTIVRKSGELRRVEAALLCASDISKPE